jgi:two-component system LytT family sensor kinase
MKKVLPKAMLHLLLWAGVWFFFYYFFSYNSPDKGYVLWFASLLLPLTAALTYFSVYYLIPRYLFPKDYGKLALYGFFTLVASSYVIVLIISGCMFIYRDFNPSAIPPMVKNFFFILILVYLVVGMFSFISILRRSFRVEKSNRELQHKMLSAQLQFKEQELNYLKKQIHPHFLFNTLNTIYGLALKKSSYTPEIILRLSNLLDYILYQVDKPMVSLLEEISHIEEYIELEKFRFQDNLNVELNNSLDAEDIQIAPMLLIPFVENAFKHGKIVRGFLNIQVDISSRGPALDFRIRNTIQEDDLPGLGEGIGLENFRKRLDLNYAGAYTLENRIRDGWYEAHLQIDNLMMNLHGTKD